MTFENHENYIAKLTSRLDKYFDEQKPYIFCKKGCSYCCSLGSYHMSQIEFEYMMHGFEKCDAETKKIIINKIKKLKKDYSKYVKSTKKEEFEHSCPFLIAKSCSIYPYRAFICRTFGLIKSVKTQDNQQVAILPDCVHKGLNYSNVFDPIKNEFDTTKITQIDFTKQPEMYDISLPTLYAEYPDKSVDFNNRKNLIDFLIETKF